MDISVNVSAEQLELQLGACQAKLTISQAETLRNQLAKVLLNALHQQPDYWPSLTIQLEKLDYLTAILFELNDEQLMQVIQAYHQPYWLVLVRFARKKHPKLATRLLKTIGRLNSPIFISLEELTDQLHLESASSIAEVITALETLQPIVQQHYPELLAKKNPPDDTSSFNARAVAFLANLSDLPTSNLRLILKSLSGEELGLLFSACKMLAIAPFFTQLETILPEKLFQQLENKCSTHVEETRLRNLLNKLSYELKELKNLLKNRSQQ